MSPADRTDIINTQRLLALRTFAGFEDLDLTDAALILGAMNERTLPTGSELSKSGIPVAAAWFVVEGELAVQDVAGRRLVRAGETVGMLELLSGTNDGLEIESTSDAIVLELERSHFMAMLNANFEMLANAMRSLSRAILMLSPLEPGPKSKIEPRDVPAFNFVDSLLLLHELSPFGAVGAETMAELAASLSEQTLSGIVEPRGQLTEHIYLVLKGELSYGTVKMPAGSGFGALHSLAEIPLAQDLTAAEGTHVFVWTLNTIMDALEDDIPFALTWLRGMAARVHDLARTPAARDAVAKLD